MDGRLRILLLIVVAVALMLVANQWLVPRVLDFIHSLGESDKKAEFDKRVEMAEELIKNPEAADPCSKYDRKKADPLKELSAAEMSKPADVIEGKMFPEREWPTEAECAPPR